ncbi:hypothetical protein IWW37_005954 [Coemansia sp. RSA 2050]|nr:hypothetical protein IWW37_005954 [Coemansia sp. RSA 2050]KAJ2730834.1 hypothetical protein IW152_004970 [Coemansia sp. BCRC 34962]
MRTCAVSFLRSRAMATATQPALWRQQPAAQGGIVARLQGMRSFHSSPIRRIEPAAAAGEPASSTLASAATQVDPTAATHAAMQIGDLAKYGLDTYLPTRIAEYALEYVHVATGLPWWATVVLVVVAVRASMFPLALWSQRHQVAVNQVAPDLKLLTERQKAAATAGETVTSMRLLQEAQTFHKRHGTHPVYAALGNLANLPYMVFMFFGLRDLAKLPFTGMDTGGLLWFTDLAAADPTYILPVLSSLGMVATMELQNRLTTAVPASKEMKWGMRIAGLSMVFFVSKLPTCVFVFWMANNLFSLVQILLFSSRAFCRLAGIATIKPVKFARAPESMLSKIDLRALIMGKKPKAAPKYVKGRRV